MSGKCPLNVRSWLSVLSDIARFCSRLVRLFRTHNARAITWQFLSANLLACIR
jgi:hypothetical protein